MKIENSYATLDPRLYHKQPPKPLNNPQAGHFRGRPAGSHLSSDERAGPRGEIGAPVPPPVGAPPGRLLR